MDANEQHIQSQDISKRETLQILLNYIFSCDNL